MDCVHARVCNDCVIIAGLCSQTTAMCIFQIKRSKKEVHYLFLTDSFLLVFILPTLFLLKLHERIKKEICKLTK